MVASYMLYVFHKKLLFCISKSLLLDEGFLLLFVFFSIDVQERFRCGRSETILNKHKVKYRLV